MPQLIEKIRNKFITCIDPLNCHSIPRQSYQHGRISSTSVNVYDSVQLRRNYEETLPQSFYRAIVTTSASKKKVSVGDVGSIWHIVDLLQGTVPIESPMY